MKILAIHGVGHADAKSEWQGEWRDVIGRGLRTWQPNIEPKIEFLQYDELFEQEELNSAVVLQAFVRLGASGLFHGLADLARNRRGLGDLLESVRWTAGMVAQWVALDGLRRKLRQRVKRAVSRIQPDVVVAHSLGSLIAYDTFRRDEIDPRGSGLIKDRTLITLGSQIGNTTVRSTFGGRIEELSSARFWWHLYNENDDVFTAPIALPNVEKFRQVDAYFDIEGWADHDGACYLKHEEVGRFVWQDVAAQRARSTKASPPMALAPKQARAAKRTSETKPGMRALLVGIADYPNVADRLDGPINDVFNMSATLQELGFPADSIRVVLDDRATTEGIRERLRWLLADAKPDDTMFFYFAGHGAQVPGYGQDSEVDRIDECLVPYDFDWSQQRAITDDEFAALYSQLPYDSNFIAALDCCHSGGLARAGSAKARVVTPPDDVRHRMLRWDRELGMWLLREQFEPPKRGQERRLGDQSDRNAWLGKSGNLRRLGRATPLWTASAATFRKTKEEHGHKGPYAPILFEACGESESAYEYRHGATSHGAFTYALCEVLRKARDRGTALTFADLNAAIAKRVGSVVAEPQSPQLVCPGTRRREVVPGLARKAQRRK